MKKRRLLQTPQAFYLVKAKFLGRVSQAEVPGSSTWLAAVLPASHKNLLLNPLMGWKPAGTSPAH